MWVCVMCMLYKLNQMVKVNLDSDIEAAVQRITSASRPENVTRCGSSQFNYYS